MAGQSICFTNHYQVPFFMNVGVRSAMMSDVQTTLNDVLYAQWGNGSNAARDFVLPNAITDNMGNSTTYPSWYDRLTLGYGLRYEMTRAVQSVYSGGGFVRRDDFTGFPASAPAIPVRSMISVPIWWGNGPGEYPRFEDASDYDYVLFRGQLNNRYRVTATARPGSPVVPAVHIFRWNSAYPWVAGSEGASGSTTVVETPQLTATDWYVVQFSNSIWTSGSWEADIALLAGDDFGNSADEGYPMASGASINGQLSGSNFRLFVAKSELYSPAMPTW